LPDKRLLATEQMLDETRNIIAVLVGKALEGDTNATSIVLATVMPSILRLRRSASTSTPARQLVSRLPPCLMPWPRCGRARCGQAHHRVDQMLADVRTTEELDVRIAALEEARGL
jgi:hypothetical protein